jgi:hypothetical protein
MFGWFKRLFKDKSEIVITINVPPIQVFVHEDQNDRPVTHNKQERHTTVDPTGVCNEENFDQLSDKFKKTKTSETQFGIGT